MARTRRLVGLFTLIALLAILAGITGFELPFARMFGGANRPASPGVRATAANPLLRVGRGAPPGGELAFLAIEPDGNLFVSDARRQALMRFDPSGQLLSEWGPRLGDLVLGEPAGVAVFGGTFYVVDRGSPRIFRLDATGRVLRTINLAPLGTYGVNGLAVDRDGNIYAADSGRNRLLVFSPNGQLIKQVGHGGNDIGGFTQPMMVAFAPDATFFVADWENGRVEHWDAAFQAIDAFSTGFRPFGVAVDQFGRVFAPDYERRRIEVFASDGSALGEIGAPGAGPLLGVSPKQVAVSGASLYVLGADGLDRLLLENTPPPPPSGQEVDPLSLAVIAFMLALLALAVLSRRQRRRAVLLGAAPDGPVRLDAEDGAQRQHQQSGGDQDLLIAHQPKREEQPARQHHQPGQDPEHHRR